jgi:DNA-directed RNA polymerase specialized sigma24 family protein
MSEEHATTMVQRYVYELGGDSPAGPIVRNLLDRAVRPRNVRQFFALANQHMRWELNDLARRLDSQPAAAEMGEELVPSPASSVSGLTADGFCLLRAIDGLFEDQRGDFDLVDIQELTQVEAAELLVVATVTVKRRLRCGVCLLTEQLADLRPGEKPPDAI